MKKPETTALHVRVPLSVKADLETIAEAERRPVANLMLLFVEQGIEAWKAKRDVK